MRNVGRPLNDSNRVFGLALIVVLMISYLCIQPEASAKIAVSKSMALAEAERYEWFAKETLETRALLQEQGHNDTPKGGVLKGVLTGKEHVFDNCYNTPEKRDMAMALAIHESGYGTSNLATTKYNFFGIYYGEWVTFNSVEDGICRSKNYIGKYIGDFANSDQSYESFLRIFKPYCASGCEHWNTVWDIYKSLKY